MIDDLLVAVGQCLLAIGKVPLYSFMKVEAKNFMQLCKGELCYVL